MKNMSFWVALILSIAAGLSVLVAFYWLYMPVRVVAPKQDIQAGSVLTEADLDYINLSRRDKHSMAVTDPRQVVGKYARDRLYAKEPVLLQKVTADQKEIMGVAGGLAPGETYVTFMQNEVRWPQGLKEGDSVSVMAVMEDRPPKITAENVAVLKMSGARMDAGQIDQIKNAITNRDGSITLVLKWTQLGPLFYDRTQAKELWIVPEHPAGGTGGDIYEPGKLEQLRQEAVNQGGPGQRNQKTQRTVP